MSIRKTSARKVSSSSVTLSDTGSSVTITSYTVTDSSYNNLDDTAVGTTGGYIKINGTGFTGAATVYINGASVTNTYVSATQIRAVVPTLAAGTYTIWVFVGSAGAAYASLVTSGFPSWTSSSYTSTSLTVSVQMLATGDGTLTYSLYSGTLPSGLSLSSTGLISGTVSADSTTTDLVILVNDGQLQTTQQTVSLTISTADPYWKNTTSLLQGDVTPFISDASTNAFAVTPSGDTRPYNFNPYTPGYYSNYFDGTGDYLSVPANAAFNFGTGDFTVECWINKPSASNGAVIDARPTPQGAAPWGLYVDGSNFPYFYEGTSYTSSVAIVNNSWNHIAVVRVSGVLKIFVNGVQGYSAALSTTLSSTGIVTIGGYAAYSTGYISNVRIVNGTAVYTAAFTPPTTPLTAISGTSLLTCQSNRFIDNSTNAFTITKAGDVSVKPNHPFTPNSSYAAYGSGYFDGTGDSLSIADNAALQFGTGNFTIELWFYPTSTISTQILLAKGSGADGFEFRSRSSGGGNYFSFWAANGGTAIVQSSAVFTLNTWQHLAVVRSSGTMTLYKDGVNVGSAADSTSFVASGSALKVAVDFSTGAAYSTGYVSDVRIVKGSAVYTSAFTPPTTPLTAITNTSLLTLQTNLPHNNNTILDNSTNNFAVTRSGSPVQGTFSPYSGYYSNYFDGTGDYLSVSATAAQFTSQNWTIEGWIYPTSLPSTSVFVNYGYESESTRSFIIYFSSGTLRMAQSPNGTTNYDASFGTPTFVVNTWYHLAIVRSGATVTAYQNGVALSSTQTAQNLASTAGAFRIGLDSVNYFTGYISNFRIVKGTAVYTGAFTPPSTPLATSQSSGTNIAALTSLPNNKSVYFDGTGDYLSVPQNTAFNLGTGAFTVEAWVYFTSTPSNARIIGLGDGAVGVAGQQSYTGWSLVVFSSLTALNWYRYDGTTETNLTANYSFSLNTWYHIVAVRNGLNNLSTYVNGTRIYYNASASLSYNNINSNPLYINAFVDGANNTIGTKYFPGYISNVRVVNGSSVYDPTLSTLTVPTTPLTAITNTVLLTCQSPIIIDNSTNAFPVTVYGDAAVNFVTSPFSIDAVSLLTCQSNRFIDNANFSTITKSGDVTVKPFGPFGRSAEYSIASNGGSIYLDTATSYISYGSNNLFAFGTNDFTVECWVYFTFQGTGFNIFNVGAASAGSYSLYYASGKITSQRYGDTAGLGATTQTFLLNTWYHIAAVRSSGTAKVYVNGVADSGATYSMGSVTATAAESGRIWQAGYTGTGYISNLRVMPRTAQYTTTFTPPTAPVAAIQNTGLLIDGTSGAVIDGAQAQNILTNGDARLLNTRYKYGTGSYYFDGTGDTLTFTTEALGTGDFTIEFWMYDTQASDHHIFTLGSTGWYPTGGVMLIVYAGIYCYSTGTSANNYYSNGAILNAWTHVAAVRSSGVSKIYFNGTALSPSLTNSDNISATAFTFAGAPSENWAKFIGYMDDLRITKGYARYAGNFTPPTLVFKGK